MQIRSVAWRTDVHLRMLEGAEVSDHGEFLVVRNEAIAGYRWANFMLLSETAARERAEVWVAVFAEQFPGAGHVAIGLESPAGELGAFARGTAGLSLEVSAVLAATALAAASGSRAPDAELRPLASDRDWEQAVALQVTGADGAEGSGYGDFVAQKMAIVRRVCERGEGAWFGAFRGREMQAGLGIFRAGDGLARFQTVDTHPAHRRQGLARHLLVAAAGHARARLGARRLVIVADPGYHAIALYGSLGFRQVGSQAQLETAAA